MVMEKLFESAVGEVRSDQVSLALSIPCLLCNAALLHWGQDCDVLMQFQRNTKIGIGNSR